MIALWEAFLPIGSSRLQDAAPLSAAWLMSRGFAPEAPIVFRTLRERVIPLVRQLEKDGAISWFSFLLHDRANGVPTTPEDSGAYAHLVFQATDAARDFATELPAGWLWTRRVATPEPIKIAGADFGEKPDRALEILGAQSAWYFRLIEACEGVAEDVALGNVKQYLHFFANMAQVEVT